MPQFHRVLDNAETSVSHLALSDLDVEVIVSNK